MKKLAAIVVFSLFGVMAGNLTALAATSYLEMTYLCDGSRADGTKRFKIIDWSGRTKRAHSQKVYDFKIDCNGSIQHVMDVFSAVANSDRYKVDGGALFQRDGNRRKSVKVRDAGCERVPKRERTFPSDAEARAACRGQPNPMTCELEYQGRDVWVTRMVERCWKTRYETRYVPSWKPFPRGFSPLPRGARIIQISDSDVVKTNGGNQVTTTGSSKRKDSGIGLGSVFFVLLIVGAGAFFYFRSKQSNASYEYASASESTGHYQKAEEPEEPVYEERSYSDKRSSENRSETTGQSESDEIPTTRKEACAILNISEDTSIEVAKKIHRAMTQAWFHDHANSAKDRERREKKMKQLNVALDLFTGKRT